MLKITHADFSDVNVRRLLGILSEKKNSIDKALALMEGTDERASLRQLVEKCPGLNSYLSYILGEDWYQQASNII